MKNFARIKYQIESNIADEELITESEEGYESEEEKQENEEFEKKKVQFLKKRIEKENKQVFNYTFNDTVIKYDRSLYKMSKDEIILIEPNTGIMSHFYTNNKGKKQLNKMPMYQDRNDWALDYKIDTFESKTKHILGYECFLICVEEKRVNKKEGFEDIFRYELFVTAELNLPASLVIPLWKPIIKLCALEIKSMRKNKSKSYMIKKAIEEEKEISEAEIQLPTYYENLIEKY